MVKYDFKKWTMEQGLPNGINPPQLIFEGCDGAGKSTIADWLCETIGHTITFHTSAPLRDANKNYYFELLRAFDLCASYIHQPLVIDRFHIGEIVYGSIFRPHNMTEEIEGKMYLMEDSLNRRNTKIVYVHASPKTLKKRIETRGDWYIQPGNIESILEKYEIKLAKSSLPIFRLSTDSDPTVESLKEMLTFIYSK